MILNKKCTPAFTLLASVLFLSSCAEFQDMTTPDDAATAPKKSEARAGAPEDRGGKKESVRKTADDQQRRVWGEKMRTLEASNKALRERTAALEKELAAVKSRNDAIFETVTNESAPAIIDTAARDFAVARNPYGSFLIACDGVAPYPNGYEVKLSIGNLTAASYDHYKLRIKWGNRSVEFKQPSQIPPGTWAKVSVVLAPAKAESVRTISVFLEIEDVVLKKNK